jgi:HEAT repeat protein
MLIRTILGFFVLALSLAAQSDGSKQTIKMLKDIGKDGGPTALQRVEPYLRDQDPDVRREAVKTITRIGGLESLPLLVTATRDADEEIQIRAADGLVNFYLPGYVEFGLGASLKRAGGALKGRFTDTNDQVIPPYVEARSDVVEALAALASNGATPQSKANACRALGILRARPAVPALLEAIQTKKSEILYEALVAIQKIGDPSAADGIAFLTRDLDPKVQIAAIETTGQLRNLGAAPRLRQVLGDSKNPRVKRAALAALAKLPDPANRPVFEQHISDKDDGLRAAAAEGFARLKDPADLDRMNKLFAEERKMEPRLSLAFAAVMLGNREISEFSPLQYLINTLNSVGWRGVAHPFLTEICRDEQTRKAIYPVLYQRNKAEKVALADILARTYADDARPALETLSKDGEIEVAQAGARALRTLNAAK